MISSSGILSGYSRKGAKIELFLRSYMPVEIEFDTGGCEVEVNGERLQRGRHTVSGGFHAEIKAVCPD